VPERKSFPPRILIMLAGGLLMFFAASLGIFAREKWNETDETDPGKMFAQEVIGSVNTYMPWTTPNGSRVQAAAHRVWVRVVPKDKGPQIPPHE
jgi:hypothetical protein